MKNNCLRTLCIDKPSRAAHVPSYCADSVQVGSLQTGLANTTKRNGTLVDPSSHLFRNLICCLFCLFKYIGIPGRRAAPRII